ncbi:hypothetical protein JW711_06325, partial [Candidatus Woesearchaeota archaeon]|nr:hypothetical protein [Candidatus Woesearchaeota archaeon]
MRFVEVKIILVLAILGLLSQFALAASPVILSDQGSQVKNISSGELINGADLTVLIYVAASGGSPLYNHTFSGAIVNGSWNVVLNQSLNLTYGTTYYKDYQIGGEDLDFDGNERIAFMSPLGNIAESFASFANASLDNATFPNLPSCDVKTDASGMLYCGTDDAGNATSGGNASIAGSAGYLALIGNSTQLNSSMVFQNGTLLHVSGFLNASSGVCDENSGYCLSDIGGIVGSFWSNTSADLFYLSGSVGIGNATPNYLLTVSGNASILNLTLPNLPSCDLKTDASGMLYCGTDDIGVDSVWSFNSSDLVNQSGVLALNHSTLAS